MTTPTRPAPAPAPPVVRVHRPVRAHPRPLPEGELTVAAPPTVGSAASALVGWLQYLVPLLGSGGSVAFLFAVPGPRPAWLVAAVAGTAVASVVLGLGLRLVERRAARRARRRERARYLAHLDRVTLQAGRVAFTQLAVADHLHPDLPRLWPQAGRGGRLWERRPTDADFLDVRVGRGPVPLAVPVRLEPLGDPLVEHDPELLLAAEDLVTRAQRLPDAPVVFGLRQLGTLALTGPPERVRALARSMLCQLATFHAPEDLEVLPVMPPSAQPHWQWLRRLPHARAPTTVPAPLAQVTHCPPPASAGVAGAPSDGSRSHLLVLVDTTAASTGSPPSRSDLAAVQELAAGGEAAGTTVVWLAADTAGEPSELAARVRLDGRGSATFEETAPGGRLVTGIWADAASAAFCDAVAQQMAPLRLDRQSKPSNGTAPVRLLDLLGLAADPAGRRTGLRPGVGPRPGSGRKLLQVPVGRTAAGDLLMLDLDEAAEGGIGPHGLVVGATGSGKSELLRTIVAGLAATHPPDQLAFVLVDFKGGAAFASLARLPQVAGLITNLQTDLSMVDRAMAALQGELARRQRLLHQAGNSQDLRAYAAMRDADPRLEPLPRLLVVVDEFGELLAARPEFLDLFIAVGRVGRSLGMHLLLASQRLDEGRLHGLDGHLRYRICLRTFTAPDSIAVLGTPDAYHLPPTPGTALLKVDANPPLRFTAALVSISHPPDGAGAPTDLEVLVAASSGGCAPVHQVWLPPLPGVVPLDELLGTVEPGWLRMPVGLVDRPLEQAQEPLVLDLSGAAGHLAVVGAPRTGKSTLLCTVVAALAATHPPDALQLYAVDLGGGLLHRLDDLPHLGAVCGPREPERVHRLVRELRRVVATRERQFRDLGVDTMRSWHELRRAGLDLGEHGEVVLLVDNWGALVRELPDVEPEIVELAATGLHYGIHLVLAANRWAELRPALRDNLGGRLELRLNEPLESELGRAAAAALPEVPGRGLVQPGLQFQAALPGATSAVLQRARLDPAGAVAPPLRLLPTLVRAADLPTAGPGQPSGVPFALEEHRLEPVWLALFEGSPHLLVLGDAECGKTSLLRLLATALAARHPPGELALLIVDPRSGLLDLTALPQVAGYACTTSAVTRAVGRLHHRLTERTATDQPCTLDWIEGAAPSHGLDLPNGAVAPGGSGGPEGEPPALAGLGYDLGGWAAAVARRPAWRGPRYVVLVDDYDLLPSAAGSPLLPLVDLLGQGRELGFHLVLARGVAGAARAAFEPVFQRLRELGGPGLIMRGDPSEGPLLAGHKAADLPPGRGLLVQPRRPATLVQVAHSPPPARAGGGSAPGDERPLAGHPAGAG